MATTIPGDLIGRDVRLVPGARADLVHLDDAGALTAVWQGGARVL
jgi:N-acetylglucosamine-6-phosphate deacetylase